LHPPPFAEPRESGSEDEKVHPLYVLLEELNPPGAIDIGAAIVSDVEDTLLVEEYKSCRDLGPVLN
jgi:hypothetical protein